MTDIIENKTITKNKSATYLIPLLSKDVDIEFDYLLTNSFVKFNREIGYIEYPIGLLYEYEESNAFNEYNNYLTHCELYHKAYLINMTHKLYIFRFPEKYITEYKLFKEGKYSRFSSEAKALIISYSAEAYKYPPLIEEITGVLWKHASRREKLEKALGMILPKDSELTSKIVYDEETFNFNN